MKRIVQKEDPVLRQIAQEVPLKDISSAKIKKVIREMKEMLATQADGVAIAAPQIGYSLRIFVVAGKIFEDDFVRKGDEHIEKPKPKKPADLVFINPEIIKVSKSKKWMYEGCLSVRPLWGEVNRSLNATITAYDEHGTKITRGAGGLLAHIFQHETDHLNGILFIDNARNVAPGEVPEPIPLKKKSTRAKK
ncbi:MAG: peptide deformylase [bacterium]